MARVIALDFGLKRTGIAATDELQIIASPLDTIETSQLRLFLDKYLTTEPVEKIVIGQALQRDGEASPLEAHILQLIAHLQKKYPTIAIDRHDERLTSKMAQQIILQTTKKSQRQDKGLVDKISAAIILQEYMGFI